MSKNWLALAGTTLALVLVAATFDTAEAGRRGFHGGGGKFFGGRSFSGPRFYHGGAHLGRRHFGHRHRHFGRGFIIGAPLAYGAYYYGGYGSCRGLRYRAMETGSRYWWARYHDCVNGYY